MAMGAGKYDEPLSLALITCDAREGALIVLDGHRGVGFSVQASLESMSILPGVLEHMAKQIRADLGALVKQGRDDHGNG